VKVRAFVWNRTTGQVCHLLRLKGGELRGENTQPVVSNFEAISDIHNDRCAAMMLCFLLLLAGVIGGPVLHSPDGLVRSLIFAGLMALLLFAIPSRQPTR
jgi:hypothetical protein